MTSDTSIPGFGLSLRQGTHNKVDRAGLSLPAEALGLLNWVADHSLPSGVLSEQLHPHTGEPLSVSPLTWSHAAFITTTLRYMRLKEGKDWAAATATKEDWIARLFADTCDAIHGACRVK